MDNVEKTGKKYRKNYQGKRLPAVVPQLSPSTVCKIGMPYKLDNPCASLSYSYICTSVRKNNTPLNSHQRRFLI